MSRPRLLLPAALAALTTPWSATWAQAPAPSPTPAPAAAKAEAEGTTMDAIEVRGFQRRYYETDASTGLGFSASVLATPLSVVSIPTDLLDDQQVNNVEDALRNVAGVTKFKQGNGGEEKFSIRGFDASQNLLIDGARINNQFNATNIATTETANIERYEILKGPAAILYGQGLPGGVINYVTKKPGFAPETSVEYIQGSDSYQRLEVDTRGGLTERLAGRGVLAYQDSEGFRDFDARERLLINPSLLWQLGSETSLTAGVSYIEDRYTQDRGQALLATADGRFVYPEFITPETFLGIPGWNEQTESEYLRYHADLQHRVRDGWTLRLYAAGTDVDKTLFDSSVRGVNPEGTVDIRASFQTGEGRTRYLRLDNEFSWGDPSRIAHQVLVSASQDTLKNDGFSQSGNTITYDSRTRGYSSTVVTLNPEAFQLQTDAVNRSLSVQDLITFADRWVLLLGAGYGEFEDRLTGDTSDFVSPRVGLIYKLQPQTSLYTSYARGFFPSLSQDLSGNLLEPEELTQHELGVKAELFDRALLLTAAVFDLRQEGQAALDPASPDPDNDPRFLPLSETSTRGVDVQAVGEITPQWRLIAGYAYLDNETDNDSFGGAIPAGNRLPGIPEHSGSLWSVYEFNQGALRNLGLGLGVFAQSEVFIGLENQSRYAGWAQVDATAFYKFERLKVQLNLRNLFDREYLLTQALASEGLAAVRVGTSTPRQAFLSVAAEF